MKTYFQVGDFIIESEQCDTIAYISVGYNLRFEKCFEQRKEMKLTGALVKLKNGRREGQRKTIEH